MEYGWFPSDPTASNVNVWNGIRFPANTYIEFDPATHRYQVPLPEKIIDPTTGRTLTRHVEQWVSMLDMARNSPDYRIKGEVAPVRKPGRPRTPRTSDEYRSHAQAWIAAADDHEDLQERWTEEEPLREKCGCGEDDVSYLRPFFEAKHHELKKAA